MRGGGGDDDDDGDDDDIMFIAHLTFLEGGNDEGKWEWEELGGEGGGEAAGEGGEGQDKAARL